MAHEEDHQRHQQKVNTKRRNKKNASHDEERHHKVRNHQQEQKKIKIKKRIPLLMMRSGPAKRTINGKSRYLRKKPPLGAAE